MLHILQRHFFPVKSFFEKILETGNSDEEPTLFLICFCGICAKNFLLVEMRSETFSSFSFCGICAEYFLLIAMGSLTFDLLKFFGSRKIAESRELGALNIEIKTSDVRLSHGWDWGSCPIEMRDNQIIRYQTSDERENGCGAFVKSREAHIKKYREAIPLKSDLLMSRTL